MSTIPVTERNLFPAPNLPSHLSPGSYDYLPVGDKTELLKKRLRSKKAGTFDSLAPKTNSYITANYRPGPGFYNNLK